MNKKAVRLFLAGTIILMFSFANADVEFTGETKQTAGADPLGKPDLLSLRLLFNNLYVSGNGDFPKASSSNPSVGFFYSHDGNEVAFSLFALGGLATTVDYEKPPKTTIDSSRSYVLEGGFDINYIIFKQNKLFLSAGLGVTSFIGGLLVDQTSLKVGMVPNIHLFGIDGRARYYVLNEFFVTGYMSFSFVSIYSKEMQGRSSAIGNAPDYSFSSTDVEGPLQFTFEVSAEYRPSVGFALSGGIRYRTMSYKAFELKFAQNQSKTFNDFVPFFGVTFLY